MTLAPRWIINGLDLTAAPFLVEMDASDHGAPESVRSVLASMLADGDISLVDRHGNRTFEIPVLIEGAMNDAAAAEAALVTAVLAERGTLVFEPGDGSAEPSVFESFAGDVVLVQGENADDQGLRRAKLTIPCRPFARPADSVTIDAPVAVGSTTTSVDTGSVTTGWSLLSTAPAPTTNLDADPNVNGLGGWVAGGGTTSVAYDGGILATSPQITGGATLGRSYVNGAPYTVVAGRFYRFGVNVTAVDGAGSGPGNSFAVLVRWYSDAAATAQVGGDFQTSLVLITTTGDVVTPTLTAPAGAIRARMFPSAGQSPYRAARWRINNRWAPECTTSADLRSAYFDGATANTAAVAYAWSGPANSSTSTATWTAPALAVVSGAVQGTVYGRATAAIRRTNTGITAAAMASLSYIRIRGTASAYSDGQVTVADNGGAPITATSYSYNPTTGVYDILINRPGGFTNLDVTFTRTGGTVSTTSPLTIAVDQIDITDNPFASGKVQTRQVAIYGSQRTELSLSVLGLDTAGTTPVGLGEQILVHTASAGNDGRAKFLGCRSASGTSGTADATAVAGFYNALSTTATPTNFTFPASSLLSGNYLAVARVRSATVGANTLSFRAFIDPTVGDNAFDPRTGWKTAPLTVVASGAVWPQVNQATGSPAAPWVMIPLGMLRLPPADIEDAGATVTVQVARGANAVDLDEVFLLNADVGQASILLTGLTSGSYSAVRLDAATVDDPQATAWVGAANGTMLADAARWIGEQHAAAPGLLQIATVTPGCATSRVSAHYYPRFHTHVATVGA